MPRGATFPRTALLETQSDGSRAEGWDGGPEPYYLLDYENADLQANIARQAKACIDSGVYDGIMLDWSGHIDIISWCAKPSATMV